MYAFHEEYRGAVGATMGQLFDHLDDHTHIAGHMSERSWKMGWGKMQVTLDREGGRALGSHIVLEGRVFGIRLFLDQVITERVPPLRKRWQTVGVPHLVVIGSYRMGFEISQTESGASLKVLLDYDLPETALPRLLGRIMGRSYAKWCTRRMVVDAQSAFARG